QNRLRRGEPLLRAGFPPFERSLERSEAARILGRRRLSNSPARFRRPGSPSPRAKHARIHAATRAFLRTELLYSPERHDELQGRLVGASLRRDHGPSRPRQLRTPSIPRAIRDGVLKSSALPG